MGLPSGVVVVFIIWTIFLLIPFGILSRRLFDVNPPLTFHLLTVMNIFIIFIIQIIEIIIELNNDVGTRMLYTIEFQLICSWLYLYSENRNNLLYDIIKQEHERPWWFSFVILSGCSLSLLMLFPIIFVSLINQSLISPLGITLGTINIFLLLFNFITSFYSKYHVKYLAKHLELPGHMLAARHRMSSQMRVVIWSCFSLAIIVMIDLILHCPSNVNSSSFVAMTIIWDIIIRISIGVFLYSIWVPADIQFIRQQQSNFIKELQEIYGLSTTNNTNRKNKYNNNNNNNNNKDIRLLDDINLGNMNLGTSDIIRNKKTNTNNRGGEEEEEEDSIMPEDRVHDVDKKKKRTNNNDNVISSQIDDNNNTNNNTTTTTTNNNNNNTNHERRRSSILANATNGRIQSYTDPEKQPIIEVMAGTDFANRGSVVLNIGQPYPKPK